MGYGRDVSLGANERRQHRPYDYSGGNIFAIVSICYESFRPYDQPPLFSITCIVDILVFNIRRKASNEVLSTQLPLEGKPPEKPERYL